MLQSRYIKEKILWLLLFYMVVATYFCYEKVGRTMRTAIVSNLLNWLCKHIKKVRSSQPAILVLNWMKHSLSLWVSLRINPYLLILQQKTALKQSMSIWVKLNCHFLTGSHSGNKKNFWLRNWKNRNFCKRFGRKCFYSCR